MGDHIARFVGKGDFGFECSGGDQQLLGYYIQVIYLGVGHDVVP